MENLFVQTSVLSTDGAIASIWLLNKKNLFTLAQALFAH